MCVCRYPSCFDANAGLFEALLTDEDAIISDELNHASIIDGVRLCKAARYRYKHMDMADLEAQLVAGERRAALGRPLPPRRAHTRVRSSHAHETTRTHTHTNARACSHEAAAGARTRLIATDGVFSMDGDVAPLSEIADLAEKHDALLFVDECHATGFFGATGRGTDEHTGARGRVDIINSTLGKALGGATGG